MAKLPRNRQSVLVVDDEPAIREVCAYTLREMGFDVVEACDGFEALERVEGLRPGLILVDQRMPGMSGTEFIARVRDMGFHEIPVILVSAGRGLEDAFRNAPPSMVLEKPFDISDLLAAVERLFRAAPSPQTALVN